MGQASVESHGKGPQEVGASREGARVAGGGAGVCAEAELTQVMSASMDK